MMPLHRDFCKTTGEISSEVSCSFAFTVCTCGPHAMSQPQFKQGNGRLNYLMLIRFFQSLGKDHKNRS